MGIDGVCDGAHAKGDATRVQERVESEQRAWERLPSESVFYGMPFDNNLGAVADTGDNYQHPLCQLKTDDNAQAQIDAEFKTCCVCPRRVQLIRMSSRPLQKRIFGPQLVGVSQEPCQQDRPDPCELPRSVSCVAPHCLDGTRGSIFNGFLPQITIELIRKFLCCLVSILRTVRFHSPAVLLCRVPRASGVRHWLSPESF
jgi:hypothetical protein